MNNTLYSKRWFIGALMFFGILVNYLDRVNISHTILVISEEFSLSHLEQGLILSAFSWGYVLFMLPGGIFVDKYGAKIVNAFSCAIWSLFTALTGLTNGYWSLIVTRLFLGGSEAPIFPGNAKVVKSIFPTNERGRATAIFDMGSYVGGALSAPIVIFIMINFGWRVSFFVCSAIGVIWSIIWFFSYKENSNNTELLRKDRKTEWVWLLKERKILGMGLGFFCYNYLKSFFLTWFPSYLVSEKGFNLIKVGYVSLIPPFCAVLCEFLSGLLTDRMIQRGYSITLSRKLPLCIGMIFSSCISFSVFINDSWGAVALLSVSYASLIAASPSIWSIPGDVAPNTNYVGTIGGIQNTVSNIAGIVAPIITGYLFDKTGSFVLPLIISGFITMIGAISYWVIVGELVPISNAKQSIKSL